MSTATKSTIPDPAYPPQPTPSLACMVEQLAILRQKETGLKLELEREEIRFRQKFGALIAANERIKEDRAGLERIVREMAVTEHMATGDKNPAPGVFIRLRPSLQINEEEAIRWAIKNAPQCLSLNVKVLKEWTGCMELDFVTPIMVPTPALDADLSHAVERAKGGHE